MNQHIDKAVYNANKDLIASKRYNPLLGILLTAASIVMLWGNSSAQFLIDNDMLSQWNLLLALTMLSTGLTMICYYLFGDSISAVDKTSGERLYRSEYFFETNELPKITQAIEQGNFSLLEQMPKSYQPAAQVIIYKSDSGSLVAAQALQYQNPVCDIIVFKKGEYSA